MTQQSETLSSVAITDGGGHFCAPSDDARSTLEIWAPETIGGWCAGRLELPAGSRPKRVVMPLTRFPITRMTGRVVTAAGTPVAGAIVDLHGIEFDGCTISAGASVKASRTGVFTLEGLRGDYEVLVHADGFATRDTMLLVKDRAHDVVLDEGSSWSGRVLAPDGSVVRTAALSFSRINRDRLVFELTDGAFDMKRLTPGSYTMKIESTDHPTLGTRIEWRDIVIADGEHRTDDVKFSSGIDLAGVVTGDAHGCVVAAPAKYNRDGIFDMRIRVKPTSDGHFVMHQVPRGDWVLSNCVEYPKIVVDAGRTDVVVPSH